MEWNPSAGTLFGEEQRQNHSCPCSNLTLGRLKFFVKMEMVNDQGKYIVQEY